MLAMVHNQRARDGVPPLFTDETLWGISPFRAMAKSIRGVYNSAAFMVLIAVISEMKRMACIP